MYTTPTILVRLSSSRIFFSILTITVDQLLRIVFWYLDINETTAVANTGYERRRLLTAAADGVNVNMGGTNVNVIIPFYRYSFSEDLQDKMLVPMQPQFEIQLNDDDELIHTHNGVAAARVVINRFHFWIPKITPKDSMYSQFVSSFPERDVPLF